MKVFLKRNVEIISFPPENSIILKSVHEDYFEYEVRYRLYPQAALGHNINTVLIEAYPSRENMIIQGIMEGTRRITRPSPEDTIEKIQKSVAMLIDRAKAEQEQVIFKYISDFTAKLPNQSLKQLLNTRDGWREKVLETVTVRELTNSNDLSPILTFSTSEEYDEETRGPVRFREECYDLLRRDIDPAEFLGNRANSVVTAEKAFAGVYQKPSISYCTTDARCNRVRDYLMDSVKYMYDQKAARDDGLVQVYRTRNVNYITIRETLKIPREGIGNEDKFYLKLKTLNNKGLYINSISATVPHSQLLSVHSVPIVPPSITVTKRNNLGRVLITLKQNDPRGSSVNLYKKIISNTKSNIDSKYQLISNIDCEYGRGEYVVEDRTITSGKTIYRAVAVNNEGVMSSEFTSVVHGGVNNDKEQYASVISEVGEGAISTTVSNIPSGVVSIELRRVDKSIRQKDSTFIGSVSVGSGGPEESYEFIDEDVKLLRIYEYTAYLFYRTGEKVMVPTPSIIEYYPINKNIIELTTDAPTILRDGSSIDVQFSISKNIIQTDSDALRSFLNQQGYLGEYQDELIANREKISGLFGVEVFRTNHTTGAVETFGILTSDDFSDLSLGPANNVSPLEEGNDYTYTLKARSRNIETLFETLEREVQTGAGRSYMLKPAKWHHPATLSLGNIVSDASLLRNHAKSNFTFGDLGNTLTLPISIGTPNPSTQNGLSRIVGDNLIELSWTVEGDPDKIDHYLVILETSEMKDIVGKCHNVSKNGEFKFLDDLTDGESGMLYYIVIPVFCDYTIGDPYAFDGVVVNV